MEKGRGIVLLTALASALALGSAPIPGSPANAGLPAGDPGLPKLCILSTSPADGQVDVPLDAPIVAVFCEPPEMSSAWFQLVPSAEPYVVGLNADMSILTINHLRLFETCTQYWATIGSGSQEYTWTFFTVCTFVPPDDLTIRRM